MPFIVDNLRVLSFIYTTDIALERSSYFSIKHIYLKFTKILNFPFNALINADDKDL